jgi:hypothetical protein
MSDWRSLCRGKRIKLEGDDAIVHFENGRSHRVRVHETTATFEIHAVVARAAAVRDVPDLPLRVWCQNRAAQLVSFRIDARGRVYAEGWVPKAGLTAEEFQLVMRRVAAESDRFEFLLTGRDLE